MQSNNCRKNGYIYSTNTNPFSNHEPKVRPNTELKFTPRRNSSVGKIVTRPSTPIKKIQNIQISSQDRRPHMVTKAVQVDFNELSINSYVKHANKSSSIASICEFSSCKHEQVCWQDKEQKKRLKNFVESEEFYKQKENIKDSSEKPKDLTKIGKEDKITKLTEAYEKNLKRYENSKACLGEMLVNIKLR